LRVFTHRELEAGLTGLKGNLPKVTADSASSVEALQACSLAVAVGNQAVP
jgi:hypothetical protein